MDLRRSLTKEESMEIANTILRKYGRELTGIELVRTQTMLSLLTPVRTSNNQRTITDEFIVGDTQYDVTYWEDGTSSISKILLSGNK